MIEVSGIAQSSTGLKGVTCALATIMPPPRFAHNVIDRVVQCSEVQIKEALRRLAWTENMIVEGAAALALAAFLAEFEDQGGQTNVVPLCGGSYDRTTLQPILTAVRDF